MKNRKRNILRVGITVLMSALVAVGPIRSLAATTTTTYTRPAVPDMFITEVQTSSTVSAGEEFIELYNNTDNDIDLADTAHTGKDAWKLQYFSGSKLAALLSTTNWAGATRTIGLTGIVPAHDYYLLAATGYNPSSIVPDQNYSSTLADDGGALQLIDSSITGSVTTAGIHDQLAWSDDKTLPITPLMYGAPGAGASLQRLPNDDSQYLNQDNTLTGFTADSRLSPDNAWTPPAPVVPPTSTVPTGNDPGNTTEDPTQPVAPTVPGNQGLSAPVVTELLPNPAAPQTDEANEYIELFNPGDDAFNLNGYTLETGQTTLHDFTFTTDVLLQPHSYQAFYSADTNLSLSNSGGQARLLAPDHTLLGQSDSYGTAAEGQAWALNANDSTWHWTITPTPGAENLISTPIVLAKASVVKTTVKKPRAAVKVKGVSTTKKAKVKKAVKTKATKSTANSKLASTTLQPAAPIHPVVLAVVALLAVGYGLYEYRQDIANKFYQRRANRAARRKARS